MQPSADSLQVGNYIGALLQWRDLQDAYDAFFSVVDLHALTQPNDPAELREKTRRTAALYGFDDRGLLAPGYLADLNVIDFDALSVPAPEVVYDLPAGGKRYIQGASGYVATVKSGVVVRDHDEATGERPGTLVRGAQPAPA